MGVAPATVPASGHGNEPESPGNDPPPLVGREAELSAIERWLASPRPALVEIEGEAGIGKTVLWEMGLGAAREAGALVLASRPVEIETAVAYGALASLVEPALAAAEGVPSPRLRALEGALRFRDAPASSLDETAVALGALSVLRAAAQRRPLLVAIDDVQWLDPSSRVALTYALRNLQPGDDVAVLLTRRLGADPRLELGGCPLSIASILFRPVGLSAGALHRVIRERLGTTLSRPRLVHVHAASRGNPFHALELARVTGGAGSDPAIALPPSLAEALRARIRELSTAARSLLLTVTAAGEPSVSLLARVLEPRGFEAALAEAIESSVLVLDDGRARFSHPLFASAAYADASEKERRGVHMRLAELAETREAGARHLALAGTGLDETVAAALEEGAESACRRGARSTGAELFEQAARLTPAAEEDRRARRLIAAAQAHFQSGNAERARSLLEDVGEADSGERYHALCVLGTVLDETVGGTASLPVFERSLDAPDATVRARARRGLAQALAYVGDLDRALEHADLGVEEAEAVGDGVPLVYGLAMQSLVRKMAGNPSWRIPLERGLALEAQIELPDIDGTPSAFEADTLRLGLELGGARDAYERMLARAADHGDVRTECWCRFGLAAVETAAGRWDVAAVHAGELRDLSEQTRILRLPALRTMAHLQVLLGDAEAARAFLRAAIGEAEPLGELHNLRSLLQLEGLLALSSGDAEAALPPLRRAREIAELMAVGEPSMLTFLLDEVEAHALAGDAASAAAVLMTFDRRCDGHRQAWIVPLVLRARGLVEAAARDLDTACDSLRAAVACEDDLPLPLEQARTRLALGRVLRRLQHRSRARAELEEARARFEHLGAALWAERAREELSRVGGRSASRDELTPTEQRIAALVADGGTNREVAAALFVTPKTIEATLTRIYRKLGVRSRTELARRLEETS